MKNFSLFLILSILLLVFSISCKCQKKTSDNTTNLANKEAKETNVPYKILFNNNHSNIKKEKNVVIKNISDLKAIYASINSTRRPGLPTPKVDFNKEEVLGVFLGEKSSAGYEIQIDSIQNNGKEIVVNYRIKAPKGMASMVITQPTLLVLIPKYDLPVIFKKEA